MYLHTTQTPHFFSPHSHYCCIQYCYFQSPKQLHLQYKFYYNVAPRLLLENRNRRPCSTDVLQPFIFSGPCPADCLLKGFTVYPSGLRPQTSRGRCGPLRAFFVSLFAPPYRTKPRGRSIRSRTAAEDLQMVAKALLKLLGSNSRRRLPSSNTIPHSNTPNFFRRTQGHRDFDRLPLACTKQLGQTRGSAFNADQQRSDLGCTHCLRRN